MKKILLAVITVAILGGCSKNKQYTQDLTGTWNIYKVTQLGQDVTSLYRDSIQNYSITFASGGTYLIQNAVIQPGGGTDSFDLTGKWQFTNAYESLTLTDTANVQTVYTIFDLDGENVQLLRNGRDNYMRKVPS